MKLLSENFAKSAAHEAQFRIEMSSQKFWITRVLKSDHSKVVHEVERKSKWPNKI